MADRRFLEPDMETAPRRAIVEWQQKQVVELVEYAWENSPFYRAHWSAAGIDPSHVQSLEDFVTKVPSFGKDHLAEYRRRTGDAFAGLLCVDVGELTSITSTSGTTSVAELIPEIWDVAPPLPTISARDLWELGLRPGDKVMVPTGTFRNYWDDFYHALGLIPVFVDSWLGSGEHLLKAIEQHQIAYLLLLLPTVLELESLETKYDLRTMLSSLKGAAFAGQPLGDHLTRKIRNEWGVNLFIYTSAGDTGTAWEGREHNGFQLWEDTIFPEVIDPDTGASVADGEVGELVSTDLDNRAAPYIRFESGDLVRLSRAPSSSGRTHARMWCVGRKGETLVIGGKGVGLADIWRQVEALPECSDALFQVVRHNAESDYLRLRIGYEPERTGDVGELDRRARDFLAQQLGVRVETEMITVDQILRSSSSVAKFPRVVKQ
ncbi:phenylacetate--CoA ligase [Mycobacterium sp. CBMA293]|uniref:phenylacetate--CoA ligase family protein n=1 Tax=unclassified Mycolicibacterium TaxID=2636767 RepID=UPI0012DFE7FA|nr:MULTISPECIES: phenylacetate--CoA ligase family protein [unclassified Mycolicibacterium]MUL49465.1 phenylacetate--CoA ligase [Mycolicibacterium sp. CBMA 360]MUL57246.1 phenylacetate--CoA ligase [Mycolicibacterium sp. CBMA 335]MUL70286.1 phenylacetate--CoA ligase [Mycolicibacterium sp. CBMA 311]MUL92334.1 phenylacetate--CoA ligase [Mycolicibacterium sp. CBMA 230]MUM06755.1 phenylacetate--CoA ligase [Mycolicibacterium sp. CBMA 213]